MAGPGAEDGGTFPRRIDKGSLMDHLPPQPQPVTGSGSIRDQISPISLISAIFFLNMAARIGLGPLLPTIEQDLAIGHAEAGLFFLSLSIGYALILAGAGFISTRLTHRAVIIISALAVGLSLILVSLSQASWAIRGALFLLGLSSGIYLPSGVATLTSLVDPKDWGKVLSVHQLSPNLAYILAPLLAELLLGPLSWRALLACYGAASMAMGVLFIFFGRGGEFKSEPPTLALFRSLYKNSGIWTLILLFSLAIGINQGLFGMMPLYLINSRGLDPTHTNHLMAISRIAAFAMPLAAGIMADRIGTRKVIRVLILVSGALTMSLALVPASWLAVLVVVQAMSGVCFFPIGFAALSEMATPRTRNLAVSVTVPLGFFFGTGLIPAGLGWLGEMGRFDLGIGLLGGLALAAFLLLLAKPFGSKI